MNPTQGLWMRLAALSGLISVGFGAFAAHGIDNPVAKEWLRTGAQYQIIHALAAFACLAFGKHRGAMIAPWLFLGGGLLFSGSLYAMALGAPHGVGAITPLGGLLFIGGWASLIWAAGAVRT